MVSYGLQGKRVLITGAGTGIGRSAAIRLASEGARVALVGRRREKLEEVAKEVREGGGEALVLPTDVSSEPEVEAAVAATESAWGGLDAVIGVAGVELYAEGDTDVHELELAVWKRTIDINLTGMFLTCKHGIRALLRAGGGSVIITGSPTGLTGFAAGETAYSSSKAGTHGLARVIANEYAGRNIRVNIVVPGLIDTPINHPFLDDPAQYEPVLNSIPLGRAGQPDEVAGMFAWLLSEDAGYVVGGMFMVDGGQTAI